MKRRCDPKIFAFRLLFLTLCYLCPPLSSLNCSICKHRGVSMSPPSAPNSRFVFDSITDSCDEEEITCKSEEDYCIGAAAKAADRKYWVQKGCIKSIGGGLGSGCTEEILDVTNAKHLPVGVIKGKLRMTVCVCNTKDYCNRGFIGRLGRQNKAQNLLPSWNLRIFSALFLLIIIYL